MRIWGAGHLCCPAPRGPGGLELSGQVEIVPANDAVPDEAVAALGNLLGFLFGMFDTERISDRDGPGEAVREFDLVELLLDRLPQFDLVDVAQEVHRLNANGSPQKFVAKRYNTTPGNLSNWIKKNGIKKPSK